MYAILTCNFYGRLTEGRMNRMSQNSYNNIKKYAAFIFMVFTVLSGSSDKVGSDSFVPIGKKAFIEMLANSKLFIQDVKASSGTAELRASSKNQDDFKSFHDINLAGSSLKNIQIYILLIFVFGLFINNSIERNNTWKSAVF
jgi:hypothetical protein